MLITIMLFPGPSMAGRRGDDLSFTKTESNHRSAAEGWKAGASIGTSVMTVYTLFLRDTICADSELCRITVYSHVPYEISFSIHIPS